MATIVRNLFTPALEEIASVLQTGLKKNYKEASVTVCNCPDLTRPPFTLAAPGLGGRAAIADVGGQLNMHYKANNNKYHFDISELSKKMNGLPFYIGAGATRPSVSYTRDNSELMTNVNVQSNINLSKEAYVGADGKGNLVDYTSLEFSSLANFFASDGKPSQVLKIEARNRTGDLNIVTCMRQALLGHYGKDKQLVSEVFYL